MGLIGQALSLIFGGGRNALVETAQVFRVNAEAADSRAAEIRAATMAQLAAEFKNPRKGWFDRFIDGLNRLPRPMMALGTLGLFVMAMSDPIWLPSGCRGLLWCPSRFGG
jgi:hypothetical protein